MTPSSQYYTDQYNTRANASLAQATLDRWATDSAYARKTMACVLDLPCGDSAAERIDFFPCRHSNAPLLIFIHGGWWRFLDKRDTSFIAKSFVDAGYNVALFNYDLCPAVSVKTIVEQQLRAFAYLYKLADALEFNANQIHISGHSAGAHLAAMLCCADWRLYDPALPNNIIKSAMLLSGIYDLAPLTHLQAAQADLKLSVGDLTLLSPLTYKPNRLPVLAWAGGAESDEFKRQSEQLQLHWGKQVGAVKAGGLTHFSVVEDWCSAQGATHQAALALMRQA
jgi:arylformamidase